MPLDSDKSEKGSKAVDVSQMTWSDILNSANVPQNFKTQIMLQLQRTGQRVGAGVIAISDFGRLSVDEEIEKKRKADDALLDKNLVFEERKRLFLERLDEEKKRASRELDNVNDMINKLRRKKGNEEDVENLKEYREDLRGYIFTLGWFVTKATATRSMSTLKTLMRQFGAACRVIVDNRDKIFAGLGAVARGAADVTRLAAEGLGKAARIIIPYI